VVSLAPTIRGSLREARGNGNFFYHTCAGLSMIRTRRFAARLISQLIPRPATESAALPLSPSLSLSLLLLLPSPPSLAAPLLYLSHHRLRSSWIQHWPPRSEVRACAREPREYPPIWKNESVPFIVAVIVIIVIVSSSSSRAHGECSRGVMRASRSRTTRCRGAVCVLAWASLKTVPLRSCAGRCSTRPRTRRTKVRAESRGGRPQLSTTRILSRRVASCRVVSGWFLSGACTAATAVPRRLMPFRGDPEDLVKLFELNIRLSDPGSLPPRPRSSPLLRCREVKAGRAAPLLKRTCEVLWRSPTSTLQFRIAGAAIDRSPQLFNAHARQIKRTRPYLGHCGDSMPIAREASAGFAWFPPRRLAASWRPGIPSLSAALDRMHTSGVAKFASETVFQRTRKGIPPREGRGSSSSSTLDPRGNKCRSHAENVSLFIYIAAERQQRAHFPAHAPENQ